MINMIHQILGDSKYSVRESGIRTILFQGDLSHEPEDYIEIQRISDKYMIFEVHRDSRQMKGYVANRNDAAIYAVIFFKRLFDDMEDRMVVQNIRSYLNCGEEDKAIACIRNKIDESIYSIGREVPSKISLIKTGDKADVKFANECLAESVTLSGGYVAFYHYCKKLMHISKFYNEILGKIDCSLSCQNIKTLYILGKLIG